MLTNQLASFRRLGAFSMAQAGSFCAVLQLICACLAVSEFPVHITSTMWSIDDILKLPQTWQVPNFQLLHLLSGLECCHGGLCMCTE